MIDERFMGALQRYVDRHIAPGDFMRAVLSNDLFGAYNRADDEAAKQLPEIVKYIFNKLPGNVWGSKEIYEKWIGQRKGALYADDNHQGNGGRTDTEESG